MSDLQQSCTLEIFHSITDLRPLTTCIPTHLSWHSCTQLGPRADCSLRHFNLLNFIIFLIPAYGSDDCQYTWMLVAKTHLDHSAFWLSKLWRNRYKSGPGWTLHHHHPGTVNFFISFLIVSFSCLYALCSLLRFASNPRYALKRTASPTWDCKLRLSDENRLAEPAGNFRLSICSSSYPLISILPLPWRCLPRKRGHETQNLHANENATMTITTTSKTCVHSSFLFSFMIRYICSTGDLIRLAFAFLCIFLESQTLLM